MTGLFAAGNRVSPVRSPPGGRSWFRRGPHSMSVADGFIYNVLAMGAIFPWVYVWGPTAFADANLYWAFGLAFIAQIPISLAYCCLASVVPADAGDYVYQTRAFGRLGAIAVLSGFVVCILEWLPISGWLCATLGIAPLMLSAGVALKAPLLTKAGVAIESPGGTMLVSILVNLMAVALLIRGLRLFTTVQRVLFALTLLAIIVMGVVFLLPGALDNLNQFASKVADHLGFFLPISNGQPFSVAAEADARNYGYIPNPSAGFFQTMAATLGVVPIVWTSLQWATYSVEQNEEIEGSRKFGNQFVMLVCSAFLVTVLLLFIGATQHVGLGAHGATGSRTDFWRFFDAMNWSGQGSKGFVLFSTRILQPYPNVLAVACSPSLWLSVLISVGFLANAFQISCNCFIGMGKIIAALGRDGVLPKSLSVERQHPATRAPAPVAAYWTYFLCGIPVIVVYSVVPNWSDYGLSVVTVACGYVFCLSSLAAAWIPSARFRDEFAHSPLKRFAPWTFRLVGGAGALIALSMIVAYLFSPRLFPHNLGLRITVPYLVLVGIIAGCASIVMMRKGRSSGGEGETEVPSGDPGPPDGNQSGHAQAIAAG